MAEIADHTEQRRIRGLIAENAERQTAEALPCVAAIGFFLLPLSKQELPLLRSNPFPPSAPLPRADSSNTLRTRSRIVCGASAGIPTHSGRRIRRALQSSVTGIEPDARP